MSRVVAFTFARGGSKGLPGKNLLEFAGRPLIGHTIAQTKLSTLVNRHVVSTEDDEIARVATEHGADVPFMRPAHLASDDAPEFLAWKHAVETLRADGDDFDVMVSVPTVAPVRDPRDIDRAIQKLIDNPDVDLVITVSAPHRNPYFNQVKMADDGRLSIVLGDSDVARRQDAPPIFDITTVAYATRPDYVLEAASLFEGVVHAIEVAPERAIDIDTELDFAIANFLYSKLEDGS